MNIKIVHQLEKTPAMRHVEKRWARHARLFGMLASLVFITAGCGSDTAASVRSAVNGVVTLEGQPLPNGMIRFVPLEGTQGPGVAAVIQNGKFELPEEDGPVVGKHRIEIEATDYQGFAIDDEQAYAQAYAQKKKSPLGKNPVPAIYNRASTLTAEVKADADNTYEFPLLTEVSGRRR